MAKFEILMNVVDWVMQFSGSFNDFSLVFVTLNCFKTVSGCVEAISHLSGINSMGTYTKFIDIIEAKFFETFTNSFSAIGGKAVFSPRTTPSPQDGILIAGQLLDIFTASGQLTDMKKLCNLVGFGRKELLLR